MVDLVSAEDAPPLYSLFPEGEHVRVTMHDADVEFSVHFSVADMLGRDLQWWSREADRQLNERSQ